jgi:hypothetical protein
MPLSIPNFGAIINAEKPNPFLQLAQAIGQFPQQQEQAQMNKLSVDQAKQQSKINDQTLQDNDLKMQAQQQQLQQNARVNAQQQREFLKQMAMANPTMAQSPAFMQRLRETDQILGTNSFDNLGTSVNMDSFKTPFSSLPADQQAAFWSMPPSQRVTAGQNYSGLPADWQTRPQQLDPHTQAQIGELVSLSKLHNIEGGKDVIAAQNDTRRTNATVGRDQAETAIGRANAYAHEQEAQAAISRANSAAAQAGATIAHLNAMTAETHQKIQSGGATTTEQKFFETQAGKYTQLIDSANKSITGALAQLQAAARAQGIDKISDDTSQTGGSEDWLTNLIKKTRDPATNKNLIALVGQIHGAQKAAEQATSQYNTTVDYIRTVNPGIANYLKAVGTGNGATPEITPVGKDTGAKPMMPTDEKWKKALASGYKPLFKDGKWGLVDGSGKWWPARDGN